MLFPEHWLFSEQPLFAELLAGRVGTKVLASKVLASDVLAQGLCADLLRLDDNLLVMSSAPHRNFHKLLGNRSWEPKDFVDDLLRDELNHFEGRPPALRYRSH